MALLNKDKIEFYKDKYTGLTYEGKAIMAMKQPGKPTTRTNPIEGRVRHRYGWWSEEKRLEAASLYAAIGSYDRVAMLTKVPLGTLRRWGTEDWWLKVQHQVKRDESYEADRHLSRIVDKAFTAIEDRIENGDEILNVKTGNVQRIQMSGKDLAYTADKLFDKRQLLRGEATKITSAVDSEAHLAELAKKFAEFVRQKEEKVVSEMPPQIESS